MRPRLGHMDVEVHLERGCRVSRWIHGPRSRKDAEQGCMDLGALGRKRKRQRKKPRGTKRPSKEAAKEVLPERSPRESVSGGGTVSGAQGCPEVKQEVTGLPAGHQQPWQWQVSTKGTEKEAGLRWSAQGRGHRGESVPAQGRRVHRPVLGAPGSGGAVLRALLEADGLRPSPSSADGSPCLVFLICKMGLYGLNGLVDRMLRASLVTQR